MLFEVDPKIFKRYFRWGCVFHTRNTEKIVEPKRLHSVTVLENSATLEGGAVVLENSAALEGGAVVF